MDENLVTIITVGVLILIVYTSIKMHLNLFKMRKHFNNLAEEINQHLKRNRELSEIILKQAEKIRALSKEEVHEGNGVMTHEEMKELNEIKKGKQ